MKKLSFLIGLIILLGCTGIKTGGEISLTTSKDFYKGTGGLSLTLIENTPPKEVYEKTDFIIGFNIQNEGSHDIEDGIITLGLEKDYVNIIEDWKNDLGKTESGEDKLIPIKDNLNSLSFKLAGRNVYTPAGEQGIVYVTAQPNQLAVQSQSLKSNIAITACYPYRTEVVTTVCIDTDITNTRVREKSCLIKDINLDSQGAPIAVTKIEYKMLPKGHDFVKPEFIITLENKGNGEVIKPNKKLIENACGLSKIFSEDEQKLSFNIIHLRAYLSSGDQAQLRCEPALDDYIANVRLKEKKGIARCILDDGINIVRGTFTTPLRILIDYGYTFTVSKEITIKKP